MSSDPFSLVYDTLWLALEDNTVFSSLVKDGNRVKLSGIDVGDPFKHEVSEGDLPEVRIIAVESDIHLNQTSSSSRVTKTFEVGIATGELRITSQKAILPVEWEIIRALADWETLLAELLWNKRKFVTNTRLITSQYGTSDTDLNRGIKGWTALMAMQVEMWFVTSEVKV